MILDGCILTPNAEGPPGQVITLLEPTGWNHFWTQKADAWVMPFEDATFVLQWIESKQPGHGSILMRAIGAWAQAFKMRSGSLLCDPELVPFYEKFRWERSVDFQGEATMIWRPR